MTQTAISTDNPKGGFAQRVRSAVYWIWGSQVVSQILTWTATILVVRLLNPYDYGLFAMTQTVLTALNFLNGYSFATSLIQTKDVDQRRIGQVFGLLIVSNGLIAATQFLMAPLAADYYHQPMVGTMLRVQALIYLTTPFIALPAALLARQLDFRKQALVNLVCAFAGAGTALGLAMAGFGVWALVWAPIVLFTTRAAGLTIASGGLVRPIFDFRGARDILSFGSALMLCQFFWIVQSQADIAIAGRSFAPHDLGLYSESLFLVLIFTGRFLPPLNEVAFPAYAELHNSGKPLAPAFLNAVRMIMLVAMPFYIGLSLVADPLVRTFFGPKWVEMIPVVSGLAMIMPAMALQIVCSPTTNALGRPGIYVTTTAAGAIIMPVSYLIGVGSGMDGLVQAWHIAAPLLLLVTLVLTLPAIGVTWRALIAAVAPSFGAAMIMAAAVTEAASHMTSLTPLAALFLQAALGALVYFGVLLCFSRKLLADLFAFVSTKQIKAD